MLDPSTNEGDEPTSSTVATPTTIGTSALPPLPPPPPPTSSASSEGGLNPFEAASHQDGGGDATTIELPAAIRQRSAASRSVSSADSRRQHLAVHFNHGAQSASGQSAPAVMVGGDGGHADSVRTAIKTAAA